jgi:hypothetical protein
VIGGIRPVSLCSLGARRFCEIERKRPALHALEQFEAAEHHHQRQGQPQQCEVIT